MNKNIKLLGLILAIVGSAFSITACALGLALYLAGLLLELFFEKSVSHPRYPEGKFFLPLLISLLISLFISRYFLVSLRGFWKFSEGFILLYACVDVIRTPRELRALIVTSVSVFFSSPLSGLSQDLLGVDFVYFRQAIHDTVPPRITGPLKHYNDYGSFLVPGFSVALAWCLIKLSDRKFIAAAFAAVLLLMLSYTITRTLSRSALLAAFASLFFFSVFFRYRWFAIGGLAVLILVVWTFPSALSTRLKDIFAFKESTPERLLLIKTTLSMIKAKPLFGLGLNTYSDYFPHFRPKDYPAIMYTHNSYLQMAAEIGIVGITLYLSFIFALITKAVQRILSCRLWAYKVLTVGCIAAVFGLMTNALFESLLQSTQLRAIFWCLLGISMALATNFISGNSDSQTGSVKSSI